MDRGTPPGEFYLFHSEIRNHFVLLFYDKAARFLPLTQSLADPILIPHFQEG